MTEFYRDEWLTIYQGDARAVLPELAADSVDCIVTSPPYWGLRDYGTASWMVDDEAVGREFIRRHWEKSTAELRAELEAEAAACDHARAYQPRSERPNPTGSGIGKGGPSFDAQAAGTAAYRHTCGKCGAVRADAQLGLERTPEEYVANLVSVFRELRRVLKPSGTCWLNLGDSYASGEVGRHDRSNGYEGEYQRPTRQGERQQARIRSGLKPKDLVGIPWRVAFALQQPYYAGSIKDERDRTWLAGLMDGEGTFTILSTTSPHGSGNSYPPIAQVRMTSQGVIEKAASLVGVASPAQYPPSGTGRAVYQWRLSGGRAADVARELYPYLIEKRQQAMVAWNHQQIRESYTTKRGVTIPADALAKQQVCRDLIRRLNRQEPVVLPSWMQEPPTLNEPGWFLRSDVIWAKPNPMPESVTDRPTKAHEYLFLLTKSARYYFDADAVRERGATGSWEAMPPIGGVKQTNGNSNATYSGNQPASDGNRNLRSVWTIATRPYPGAHFAVFPPQLPERCIKAGSPHGGVILDPFAGSGTTGMVANRLSRRAILVDLNGGYLKQQLKRNAQTPLGLGA